MIRNTWPRRNTAYASQDWLLGLGGQEGSRGPDVTLTLPCSEGPVVLWKSEPLLRIPL